MDLKVLAVGDVVCEPGMDRLCRSLRYLKRKTQAEAIPPVFSMVSESGKSTSHRR